MKEDQGDNGPSTRWVNDLNEAMRNNPWYGKPLGIGAREVGGKLEMLLSRLPPNVLNDPPDLPP